MVYCLLFYSLIHFSTFNFHRFHVSPSCYDPSTVSHNFILFYFSFYNFARTYVQAKHAFEQLREEIRNRNSEDINMLRISLDAQIEGE